MLFLAHNAMSIAAAAGKLGHVIDNDLHVTRKYLADHGPFKNGLTLANARRHTTLHTVTATHNPSHRLTRHTGASCGLD